MRRELSWTHYKMILRVENENARDWYADEAVASNWRAEIERDVFELGMMRGANDE